MSTGLNIFQILSEHSLPRPSAEFPPLQKNDQLPSSYAIVPEYSLQKKKVNVVSGFPTYNEPSCFEQCEAEEYEWLNHAHALLSKEIGETDRISWAAYHASQQRDKPIPKTTQAILPIFHEKSATPAMMKHSLDTLKGITEFLNEEQPFKVMSMDQPLYADATLVKWAHPEKYCDCFLVMGGLHLVMALWNCLGDILEGSG